MVIVPSLEKHATPAWKPIFIPSADTYDKEQTVISGILYVGTASFLADAKDYEEYTWRTVKEHNIIKQQFTQLSYR